MMDPDDRPLIFKCIDTGDLSGVRRIVKEEGIAVLSQGHEGATALNYLFHLLGAANDNEKLNKLTAIFQYLLRKAIKTGDDELAASMIENGSPFIIALGDYADFGANFASACAAGLSQTIGAYLDANNTKNIVTQEILDIIDQDNYSLLANLLEMRPDILINADSYLHEAVSWNRPFCLLALIKAGAGANNDILRDMSDEIDLLDDFFFADVEPADDNLLRTACERPIDANQCDDRFDCALILLADYPGPLSRVYEICDAIMIQQREKNDFEVITFLTSLGISPTVFLRHFLETYTDPSTRLKKKERLCKAVEAACDGLLGYLQGLLTWESHQLIVEGYMGLLAMAEQPVFPVDFDNDLTNVLTLIANEPLLADNDVLGPINQLLSALSILSERVNSVPRLADLSMNVALDHKPEGSGEIFEKNQLGLTMSFSNIEQIEFRDRYRGNKRQHYQLMVLRILQGDYPDFLHYYMPEDFDYIPADSDESEE